METELRTSKKIFYHIVMEGDNVRYVFTENGKKEERLIAEVIDGHYVLSVKERGCPALKVFGVEEDYLIAQSRLEEKAKTLSVGFDSEWI